jgi:hypothetical protein
MTTQELADQLVSLLKKGSFEEAQRTFLVENAESIEPNGTLLPEKTVGLSNILAKGENFRNSIESVNGLEVSDPMVAGNAIAVTFTLDANFKSNGRMVFTELCVFIVADGKIIREIYYY